MTSTSGVVTRPSNGKRVSWKAATPIVDAVHQANAAGITAYVIGDASHLRRSGGHTPWKPGAPYGVVTATDIMVTNAAAFEKALIRLMKAPGYDTTWIDFININNSQYDFNGRRQGSSGDHHLHLEALGSRTNHRGNTLIRDAIALTKGGVLPTTAPKPTTPAATPVVVPKEEEEMRLVQSKGKDAVYLTDLKTRVHVDRARRDALLAAGVKLYVLDPKHDLAAFGPVTV